MSEANGRIARYAALAACLWACHGGSATPIDAPAPDGPGSAAKIWPHSGSIAVSADGATVYVVNADADSVSVIDTATRTLTREILLAAAHPSADGSGTYTPAVMPRALALSPDGATLYVTGERAGAVFAIDLASGAVSAPIPVGSEPIGVVVSPDGSAIFVACSQDQTVVRIDAASRQITATAALSAGPAGGEPWALAFAPDGTLLASRFHGPGLASLDPATLAPGSDWPIPDTAPRGDQRLAHGQVRGIYDVAARPGTADVWAVHLLLGTDTPQPALDFESTAFPALSILSGGAYSHTLSTDAQDVDGIDGAFGDVVSGPHAIAFTPDGAYALVVDTGSEDVLVVDAATGIEAGLVRPLPGHMPEGIAIAPDGAHAYVDERNTSDVAVLDLTAIGSGGVTVDGAAIPRLASDPMPARLRFGQQLFFSANSDEYPLTTNHWISCASCHLEGRSDGVTWNFAQGPRDTPTNAGGMLGTGLLFRTADRTQVQDYWKTIDVEQGGSFEPAPQADLLDAIEVFVDHGLPLPIPPTTDPALVARGRVIFESAQTGCATCHSGPRFTDSGTVSTDLANPGPLYDVGTCVTAGFADVPHEAIDGSPRAACMFDTPSLSGIASSPPYLHDGSAPTIMDVLEATRGTMGDITMLSGSDEAALVEYLRSL